jgi:hypothetical protein
MERRLLMAVRDKSGIPVLNRGDCEVLSDLILEATDELVNYNTLRRLYGLAKPVKPRRQTLNILSVYCGFQDYPDFCNSSFRLARWKVAEHMFSLIDDGDLGGILSVLETASDHAERMDLLIQLSRELLLTNRMEEFSSLFEAPSFDVQKWEYSHQLHFSTSVGLLFRSRAFENPQIFQNVNFLQSVFLTFVDYLSLNGFYGDWLDQVCRLSLGPEVDTFSACLVRFRSLLNEEPIEPLDTSNLVFADLHPILLSRVFSVCWMCGERDAPSLWRRLFGQSHEGMIVPITWVHEMVTYALIVGDFALMRWIRDEVQFEKKSMVHFERHHHQLFLLLNLALAIHEGQGKEAALTVSKFDLSQIRQGYRELIEVVWLRCLMALPSGRVEGASVLGSKLDRLSYPLFSPSWVLGYFEPAHLQEDSLS